MSSISSTLLESPYTMGENDDLKSIPVVGKSNSDFQHDKKSFSASRLKRSLSWGGSDQSLNSVDSGVDDDRSNSTTTTHGSLSVVKVISETNIHSAPVSPIPISRSRSPLAESKKMHLEPERSFCNPSRIERVDAEMQFDYWVPMEDLLHGAIVVDEIVLNTHGDREQEYPWAECGFSLLIPQGALSRTESCPVAVKALISGRFRFPKGFQLISALYAISPGRKFIKDVKITLQHCFLLERAEQLDRLCIVKAQPTEPENPYDFQIVNGGVFNARKQYCEVWLSDFSIVAAGVLTETTNCLENDSSQSNSDSDEGESSETGSGDEEERNETGSDDCEVVHKQQQNETEETKHQSSCHTISESHRVSNSVHHNNQGQQSSKVNTSITDKDTQLYRAHFFLQSVARNNWNFILVAIKHLNVHIKYVIERFKDEEKIESFEFRFSPSEQEGKTPAITLLFTEEENSKLAQGWFVKPLSSPCRISREGINALCTQELRVQAHEEERVFPDLPMCKASVFAEEGAAFHMEYGVHVEGIQEKKTINIVLQFNSGTKPKAANFANSASQDLRFVGTNIRVVINCIKEVVNENYGALKQVCENSIKDMSAGMFAAGLISQPVCNKPSFEAMIAEFSNGFVFMKELPQVKEHCKKFFDVLQKLGGPFLIAENSLKESIALKIDSKLSLSFSFD